MRKIMMMTGKGGTETIHIHEINPSFMLLGFTVQKCTANLCHMSRLAFRMSDTHAGFGHCDGIVHLESDSLKFEFQSKVAGILKSGIKTLEVPLSEVASIDYKPKLFSTQLELRFKSLQHAQEFPKADANEVVLELKRRDRPDTKRFVSEVQLQLVSSSLDSMLEMTNEALGQ